MGIPLENIIKANIESKKNLLEKLDKNSHFFKNKYITEINILEKILEEYHIQNNIM